MNIDKLIDQILPKVNGQRAWDWVAKITQYNRIQASNGYHEILEIIKNELKSIGFEHIEHFKSPADGETKTWDYIAPYQWELESGTLEIIEPEHLKLCDSREITTSVVTHSNTCDITAEVIDIGKGDKEEDYAEEIVSGKIVLMSSITNMYRSLLEKSKALGLIFYPDLKRTGDQIDKHIYNSFFTTKDRLDIAKFGFSVSYSQAMHIKELLGKGSVRVHAKVNSKYLEGSLEVLTTYIEGNEEKEIVLIAHLCHPNPGANDNASGAAGLLELARSLKCLIDKKLLKSPRYTIRFMWVPEFNGTIPWMKYHEEEIKKYIACLNLDMIGEHRLKIGYPLQVNLAPHSTPNILNDIGALIIKKVADHPKGIAINGTKVPMSYRLTGFEGGSDHVVFTDFYFGIASLMFGHDDPYYHSSMDTVEFCDSTELKRVIGMASTIAYILSHLDDQTILDLWPIIHQGVLTRWSYTVKLIENLYLAINNNKERAKEGKEVELILLGTDIFKAFYEYEIMLYKWIKNFSNNQDILTKLELLDKEVSQLIEFQKQNWKTFLKIYSDNVQIENEKIKFDLRFKPAFEGPFSVNTVFNLYRIPLFRDFCKDLGYEFMGPVNELINLLCKGFNLLRISSYLTLEYNTIILPSRLSELIDHLLKIGCISIIKS